MLAPEEITLLKNLYVLKINYCADDGAIFSANRSPMSIEGWITNYRKNNDLNYNMKDVAKTLEYTDIRAYLYACAMYPQEILDRIAKL